MALSSTSMMVLSAFDPSLFVDNDSMRHQLNLTITTRIILFNISLSFLFNLDSNSRNYTFDIFIMIETVII
jgi:hypothetical protein